MTVCLEATGPEAGRPYVDRAKPEHPTLIDPTHRMDDLFGVTNIPNSVWIDEAGTIVRPAEPAWPVVREPRPPRDAAVPAPDLPEHLRELAAEAAGIVVDSGPYLEALHDWAEQGSRSQFALAPDEVLARSQPRGLEESAAAAHFELGQHLLVDGDPASARKHFAESHRLQPDNWTYRRQAWSLEPGGEGPLARFWQGPSEGTPGDWPYPGDWVKDIRAIGAENYYPRFRA